MIIGLFALYGALFYFFQYSLPPTANEAPTKEIYHIAHDHARHSAICKNTNVSTKFID